MSEPTSSPESGPSSSASATSSAASLHPSPAGLTRVFDALTPEVMRARGSLKWTRYPGDVIGAWVAEMDLGTAPVVTAVLQRAVAEGNLGYLPPQLAEQTRVGVTQEELWEFLFQTSQQYGIESAQFLQGAQQAGQIPAFASEIARNKSLAIALRRVAVKDSEGQAVDLTEFIGSDEADAVEVVSEVEKAAEDGQEEVATPTDADAAGPGSLPSSPSSASSASAASAD